MEYEESAKAHRINSAIKDFGQVNTEMERFSTGDTEDNNLLFMTEDELISKGYVSAKSTKRPEVITLPERAGDGIAEIVQEESEEPSEADLVELEIE